VRTSDLTSNALFHLYGLQERQLIAIFTSGDSCIGRNEITEASDEVSNAAHEIIAVFIAGILV
jgi:hypothetical protein